MENVAEMIEADNVEEKQKAPEQEPEVLEKEQDLDTRNTTEEVTNQDEDAPEVKDEEVEEKETTEVVREVPEVKEVVIDDDSAKDEEIKVTPVELKEEVVTDPGISDVVLQKPVYRPSPQYEEEEEEGTWLN